MLIHLNSALIEVISNEIEQTEAVVQALQNLAQSRYQGDHIITADNGVMEPIILSQALNNNTRRVFSKISSEQAQIGSLRKKLITYVEIAFIRGAINMVKDGDINVIQIPLIRFERNDIIQPTFFIAENLLDCEFFITVTSWFSKKYSNGRLPFNLKAVYCPGGGDTTEKLLSHHSLNQRYLTLCITDSDQKFPGSSLGETTKKCKRLTLNSLCHHITLPTRSIENLISHNQILSTLNADAGRKTLLPRIERLKNIIGSEAWKYFHVKEGVRIIIGPHKQGTEYAYWNSIATPEDLNNSRSDGYLFPPISQKLLTWVIEHFEGNEPDDFISDAKLFDIWSELAQLIASWTCASEPIRV